MAFDSKEKRVSVVGSGRIWLRDKNPQVAKDVDWRKGTGQCYSGTGLADVVSLIIVRHHVRMGR